MYLYLYFSKSKSTCTLLKYFQMYFALSLMNTVLNNFQEPQRNYLEIKIEVLDASEQSILTKMS